MGFSKMEVEQKGEVNRAAAQSFRGEKKRKMIGTAVVNSVCKQQKVDFLGYSPEFMRGKLFSKT